MRSTIASLAAALLVQQVSGHALWQDLWVNGVDKSTTCVRMPVSNSPVTNVLSNDIRCNASPSAAAGKCAVSAGDTVTVEMHQQPNDRSCSSDAIGGAHYGPVQVYLTKVDDAATADGSTGWFKIFTDAWAKNPSGAVGDSDYWGTNDLNKCCGKMNVKIPSDIPAGDYLLRAEVAALHVAGQSGGAQFYISCYQITVSGGGSASPATVKLPGAYSASDPGILINIHAAVSSYIAPGPAVYAGGSTEIPSANPTCPAAGSGASSGSGTSPATTLATTKKPTTTAAPTSTVAAPAPSAATSAAGGSVCVAAKYAQCGGTGFTGCTTCASGTTCKGVSAPYYYQCA